MTNEKSPCGAVEVRVLSTLAMMEVLQNVGDEYRARTGIKINAEFAPSGLLMERIRSEESADVAILTREAAIALADGGWLTAERTDLAVSSVGLALGFGAPTVDITTVEKLRSVLVNAKSIAYSASGASGIFFSNLLIRLGIQGLVNDKAVVIPSGFTATCVESGQAEMAIQQISELRVVKGIGAIVPLPGEAQCLTTFSAAAFAHASQPSAARSLIAFLSSDEVRAQLASVGLNPPIDGAVSP